MNFLAHYVIAARHETPEVPRPFYVVGNALPDLLPLADRHARLRPAILERAPTDTPPQNALRAGVSTHLRTDAVFHKTSAFATAQATAGDLLTSAAFTGIRVRRFFLAHILVEMALDAALLRADASLADAFYTAFSRAHPNAVTAWTETTLGTALPDLPPVLASFSRSQYLRSYADDAGVAEGLDRLCARARQDTFTGENRRRLVRLVSSAVPVIGALAETLLAETATGMKVPYPPTTEK